MTCMKNSQIPIKTLYTLLKARYILFKHAASTTPAMTYSSSVIPSILIHISDIMLHSPANKEGADHANVWFENSVIPDAQNVRCMDFLWVHWFGKEPEPGYCSGFR